MQAQNADAMLGKRRPQLVVPAAILVVHKLVGLAGDHIALLHQRQTIGSRFGVAIFNLLHQAGHAHFEELIQVAGRDGKKFQPLEQRVASILRFFEDAAVERQPGGFPVDVVGRIVQCKASHGSAGTRRTEIRNTFGRYSYEAETSSNYFLTGAVLRICRGCRRTRLHQQQLQLHSALPLHRHMMLVRNFDLHLGVSCPAVGQIVGSVPRRELRQQHQFPIRNVTS